MSNVFDLTARAHTSQVLGAWLAEREGGAQRAGIQAVTGENSVTTNLTAEQLMQTLGLVGMSEAGVSVTPETALRVATVYSCVALVAGAIASLPVGIYERSGMDRRPVDHDYWWFLNEQANDEMSSATAWEMVVAGKLFYGDGFAEWLRPSPVSSRVIGMQPLHPLRVDPFRDSEGNLLYRYQPERGPMRVLFPDDVLHIPSLGFDGLCSPSPITYAAREAIGAALAGQSYSSRFFSQGATFDYALKTASTLNKEQLEALKASLLARVRGNRSPLILTGGLEPAQLSVNSKDAEILATRLFTVEEICRIFGVPPHLVGHTEKVSAWGTGLEAIGAGFVRYTLRRHLTPIAQEINRKLWPTRARYFADHVTSDLERGDMKARYEAYRIALGRAGEQPFMDATEIRRRENLPPNENLQTNPGANNAPQPPDATAG